MSYQILLIDEPSDLWESFCYEIGHLGCEMIAARNIQEAREAAQLQKPDIILIDPSYIDQDFFSVFSDLDRSCDLADVPRIIVTAEDSQDVQMRGLIEYADDYVTKPFDLPILAARIEALLRRAGKRAPQGQAPRSRPQATDKACEIEGGLLGACPEMREIFTMIQKFAKNDAPVLLTGESGTGKELAAHAIHQAGPRAKGPFVAINCGAIPENLIEAELFGYEKGAFTGAVARKEGKVEVANGGTLFLDEVGELPLPLQVKLLRFLEDFRFERVGGTKTMRVNVRVIAATNKNLEEAIASSAFREDLYYRLAVLALSLPPLRERGGDTILIAKRLFRRFADESQLPLEGFSPAAVEALEDYPWPGNVRELVNCVRRAVVMAEGEWIEPDDLGLRHDVAAPAAVAAAGDLSLQQAKEQVEKVHVEEALAKNGGNISRTAREIGVSRPTLYAFIRKYNIQTN